MSLLQSAKNVLKSILPPPTKSFMREVDFLKQEHTELQRQLETQNERLDRLYSLFESANRENLRIYFDARAERDELYAQYEHLNTELKQLHEDISG